VELCTSGDLKLVERPQTQNIGPYDYLSMKTSIKVSSTEAGVIFGSITFDNPVTKDKSVVILNSIHMDVVDYIKPASCNDAEFRKMWSEFEWENKVAVSTDAEYVFLFYFVIPA
jgi:coatomer subunit beta